MAPSWANNAYEYCVPGVSEVSVTVAVGELTSRTRVPSVAEAGATAPLARRIITPASEACGGLAQDSAIVVVPGVARAPVTSPGGTTTVVVVAVTVAPVA